MKKSIECFGTFVLVLGGCGTALFGHVGFLGVAIAFGLTVIAMAYGIGHVSGAHLNPAVSFGVWVNGRMKFTDMLLYWVSQLLGAIVAGAVLFGIYKAAGLGATGVFAANGYGEAFQAAAGEGYLNVECFGTFVLVLGGCGTALFGHVGFLGVAIAFGLTLVLIHLISIPLTNTSVNPARSISQAIFSDCATWSACSQLWLFIVAPLVGAAVAGLFYKCVCGDCCCKKCCKKD